MAARTSRPPSQKGSSSPPPGFGDLGTLVFCSDGLFEAVDRAQTPYGYDRPRDLLRTLADRPTAGVLEALFADWQRYLKAEEPPDDTTVVVLRRIESSRIPLSPTKEARTDHE